MTLLARRTLLPLSILLAVGLTATRAEALDPGPSEPVIAASFAEALQQGHYSHKKLDDTLSSQWFDAYINRLDYGRIYFLKSDIDEFASWRTKLDDSLRDGSPDLTFAFQVFNRLVKRIDERVAFTHRVLTKETISFDNPDARVDLDRHDDPWATSTAELDALWRARITEQLLRMELADGFAGADDTEAPVKPTFLVKPPKERLAMRYDRIVKDHKSLASLDVLEIYLGALSGLYDPHSAWMKPITRENFDIDMADTLSGIGAVLQADEGYTVIRELVPGGPAGDSGELEAGDRIIAVAQGDGAPVDVVEMRLDNVVQLIRGPINTEVVLSILPSDATDPSDVVQVRLTRERVKLDHAASEGPITDVDGGKVGVIKVPSFYVDMEAKRNGNPDFGSTTTDVARILADYPAKGVDVVVIDLRTNGGGSLDEAITMTGLFLEGGPVVQTRDSFGRVDVYKDEDVTTAWDGPLVVLTSEASASASEIFAGAIQDYGRGLIVGGVSTHGKGTVQHLVGLDRAIRGNPEAARMAGAVKYTSHMFFRVNGDSTQIKGVASDVVLPSVYEGLDIRESDLEHPLPWDAIRPAVKATVLPVDVAALQKASAQRVKQSMEFAFLEEDINERNRLDAIDTLSLHAPTRRAEIERRKKIEEARESARDAVLAKGMVAVRAPVFGNKNKVETEGIETAAADGAKRPKKPQPDPIMEEALLIARDFVRQLD